MSDSLSVTHDAAARSSALARDVGEGLSMPQKQLDPKYFYDERGSALFEKITTLDEYYLTRAERSILIQEIPRIVSRIAPRSIVELGAGSAAKTRVILDAMTKLHGGVYVPVDVSEDFLSRTADSLRAEYPTLVIKPAVSDFTSDLRTPKLPHPTLTLFLGSTIGNFEPWEAIRILRRIKTTMRRDDRFLLGIDLRKDITTIERAYNDGEGVTAEFNRNILRVLNAELGANFDPARFDHLAFYNEDVHRIEMHLVSREEQTVTGPRIGVIHFDRGESVRTELSYKYDREQVESFFAQAGLVLEEWLTDEQEFFALALARAREVSSATTLDIRQLRAEVESLFQPQPVSDFGPVAVGAELELIPVESVTHRIIPAFDNGRAGSIGPIRNVASREGWSEIPSGNDPPCWSLGDGWRLSYEPGGQLEISSAPSASASVMIERMLDVIKLLRTELSEEAIELRSVGVDPCNAVGDVPLQLNRARYTRMTDYFARVHSSGARMMRQSASIQINIELGVDPARRWRLLNALAPFLTAMFANSPQYRGAPTGHRSYRAHLWRTLDPSRTGLPVDIDDPVGGYLTFALNAGAMMRRGNGNGRVASFNDWIAHGSPTIEDWRFHLTTLFPEVRPRSWFEVRSVDAIPPEWMAAPIGTVCGIAYSQRSSDLALSLMGDPDEELLRIGGEYGLGDERIARTSIELATLALEGLDELGDDFMTERDRRRVRTFFERYTFRNRAPADDRD